MTRLSVNINKIALIRNSRGGNQPDVLKAALDCEEEHLLKRNGIAAEEKKEEEAPAAE